MKRDRCTALITFCLVLFSIFIWSTPGFAQTGAKSNYALDFDHNTLDFVQVSDNASLHMTNRLTLEAWVNIRSYVVEAGIINNIFDTGYNESGYGLTNSWQVTNAVEFIVRTDNTSAWWSSCYAVVTQNTWHHIAGVYDGSTAKLYVDGVEVASTPASGNIGYSPANDLWIGKYQDDNESAHFDGMIDEVRIWNTNLSAATLQTWKNSEVSSSHPNYANLVSYWKFNEGTGLTASDSKGSNHGSLQNSPAWVSGAPLSGGSTGGTGTLTGRITDATNGNPIQGATVSIADLSTTTDSDGRYTIANVPPGTILADFTASPKVGDAPLTVYFTDQSSSGAQRVTAVASGYIEYVNNQVTIESDQTQTLDISLSPTLSAGSLRFVLNWGADPRDLDSYLRTPQIEGYPYTVYYNNKGSVSAAPYAILDHDVTQGYGPETVTIHQLYAGTYYYYIHRYTGSGYVSTSGAVIQIYNQYGLLQTVQVPTSGEGDYWNVCTINGSTGQITLVNQIQSSAPGSKGGAQLIREAKKPEIASLGTSPRQRAQMEVTSRLWNFGDGQTSAETNPSHAYQDPGYYTVTLTVNDGSYQVSKTKTDYIQVTGTSTGSTGTLTGHVADATNGSPIQGATVAVAGLSTTTDASGQYTINNVPVGTLIADFSANPRSGGAPLAVYFSNLSSSSAQRVTATATGYIEYINSQVSVYANQTQTLDISLSPILAAGNLRFVLNWGADPRDLDSYLKTPQIEGSWYTVYYNSKGSATSAPYAILDYDVTQGYGPETMTIHQLYSGMYYYYIHRYAGLGEVRTSGAVVQIYNQYGLLQTIPVPSTGEGDYWNVCAIDGSTGQISLVNVIQSAAPGAKGGDNSAKGGKPSIALGQAISKKSAMSVTSSQWNFGDGQSSTETHPVHIYQNPGNYTVTLTVSDGSNQATETKTNYVEVTGSSVVEITLLSEGFEGDEINWSYIDNNSDGVYWSIYSEEAPADTVAHSGLHGAGIYYNNIGNDDYLVSPEIQIPAGTQSAILTFWSRSHSSVYLEDFDVRISTTGTDVADFAGDPIMSVRNTASNWTLFTYEYLSSYAGQSIYIAFHNISVDKFYQFIDDVVITATVATDVDQQAEVIPHEFELLQNYPNPFNPGTEITFSLPTRDFVTLEVFNLRGEKVRTLLQEQMGAGVHSVRFDASDLPNGVYLYSISSRNFSDTKKCLLLK